MASSGCASLPVARGLLPAAPVSPWHAALLDFNLFTLTSEPSRK